LVHASEVRAMLSQTFRASHEQFDRFIFEASCDFHYSTCVKRLRMHPWHLTCSCNIVDKFFFVNYRSYLTANGRMIVNDEYEKDMEGNGLVLFYVGV
jgi:hypothetical protein